MLIFGILAWYECKCVLFVRSMEHMIALGQYFSVKLCVLFGCSLVFMFFSYVAASLLIFYMVPS